MVPKSYNEIIKQFKDEFRSDYKAEKTQVFWGAEYENYEKYVDEKIISEEAKRDNALNNEEILISENSLNESKKESRENSQRSSLSIRLRGQIKKVVGQMTKKILDDSLDFAKDHLIETASALLSNNSLQEDLIKKNITKAYDEIKEQRANPKNIAQAEEEEVAFDENKLVIEIYKSLLLKNEQEYKQKAIKLLKEDLVDKYYVDPEKNSQLKKEIKKNIDDINRIHQQIIELSEDRTYNKELLENPPHDEEFMKKLNLLKEKEKEWDKEVDELFKQKSPEVIEAFEKNYPDRINQLKEIQKMGGDPFNYKTKSVGDLIKNFNKPMNLIKKDEAKTPIKKIEINKSVLKIYPRP
jgi:hypothetical protein